MTMDARGTPVSCGERAALDRFEEALRQAQTYVGDPIATIERALAEHPDFVAGHLLKAGALATLAERRFFDAARPSLAAAEELADHATPRERAHMAALRHLLDGEWDEANRLFDAVLVDHPRDALALLVAHLFDFYRGDALNLRNRIGRVLPHWSPDVPGYSFVLGMHAFGLEECNQYPEAESVAHRALALEARDAWAIHAATHVLEMQGRVEEGIDWLESRRRDWAVDNALAPHNAWHLALFHLDRGNHDRVLAIFDAGVLPAPSDLALQLLDASALLWRLYLGGVDVGPRFEAVADAWEAKVESEGGFYAFNDAHAMMALAATGRERAADRLLRRVTAVSGGDSLAASMARRVGLPVARSLLAFSRGRYDEVVAELGPVRDVACHFGGSHAQRDVITLTVIEAAIRGGQHAVARHWVADRNVQRPASALGWRLRARASA